MSPALLYLAASAFSPLLPALHTPQRFRPQLSLVEVAAPPEQPAISGHLAPLADLSHEARLPPPTVAPLARRLRAEG